jgi:DNA-directed RNA polymerase I subunit RPA1
MIVSAVFITMRDTFFTRYQFQQLLYVAIWNLFYDVPITRIEVVPPAILKPRQLWTGK